MNTGIGVVSQDLFETVEKINEKNAIGRYHKKLRFEELLKAYTWLKEKDEEELEILRGI